VANSDAVTISSRSESAEFALKNGVSADAFASLSALSCLVVCMVLGCSIAGLCRALESSRIPVRSKGHQNCKLHQNCPMNNRASVVSPIQPKGLTGATENPHHSPLMVV